LAVVEQVTEAREVPLERLEAEICEGAAHLFAGMARWLARYLSVLYDEDGSLVGTFRLDVDEGAAIMAALTLGKDLLREKKRSAERTDEKRSAERFSEDDCGTWGAPSAARTGPSAERSWPATVAAASPGVPSAGTWRRTT
jgi:hypothetical protein